MSTDEKINNQLNEQTEDSIVNNQNIETGKNINEDKNDCKEMTKEELYFEYRDLQLRFKELEEKHNNIFQQFQRLQADFENFRKRTIKEKDELRATASKQLIEEMLPVLDNFLRALEVSDSQGDIKKFLQGIEMIYNQFWSILQNQGLETIDSVGCEFNPEVHQAVMQKEVEDGEDNQVIEEIQKGYMLKGKLIRPSMVVVSKKS